MPDSLPEDLKCNGEKIVIQVRGDKNTIAEFFADEQTGESVNDATYVRNMNGPLKTEAFQKGLAENGHLTYAPVPLHRMELIGTRVWLPAARQ